MEGLVFIENIFEVSVGKDPKTDMRYNVGKEFSVKGKKVKITHIVYDDTSFAVHGKSRAFIYVRAENGGEEKLWKILEDQSLVITLDLG